MILHQKEKNRNLLICRWLQRMELVSLFWCFDVLTFWRLKKKKRKNFLFLKNDSSPKGKESEFAYLWLTTKHEFVLMFWCFDVYFLKKTRRKNEFLSLFFLSKMILHQKEKNQKLLICLIVLFCVVLIVLF